MSRLSRRLLDESSRQGGGNGYSTTVARDEGKNEPSWLERDMGHDAYLATAARVERQKEEALQNDPKGYVNEEISTAQRYLNEDRYLAARIVINVLIRLAKERNLTLPDDIDRFHKRILIEGAYGYYREYLNKPGDGLDKRLAQRFSEEGGIQFSEVEESRGIINEQKIKQMLEADSEGGLRGNESKG